MERDLLRKLATHYVAARFTMPPTSVFVSPTLRCSSSCAHCGVWRSAEKTEELTAGEWATILGDAFFARVGTLWFSGGEPTLRADLAELTLGAADSLPGLRSFTVATNALHPWKLENFLEDTLPYFKRRGIYTWIHLSLDGPSDIHDRMRGVKGAYNSLERTVKSLARFRERGASIGWGFNCVVTDMNAEHLVETKSLANELGAEITFNVAYPEGGFYRGDGSGALAADKKETARAFFKELVRNGDPYYRRHYETVSEILDGKPRSRRCETLEATLYLDPDGSAYPCPAAYDLFRARAFAGGTAGVWAKLFKYRRWIRHHLCPTCALGCSFGEGITLSEFIELSKNPTFSFARKKK